MRPTLLPAAVRRLRAGLVPAALTAAAIATPARAQLAQATADSAHGAVVPASPAHATATRTELEVLAQQAERSAASAKDAAARQQDQREAAAIRARLAQGDFQPGDRLVVDVQGDSTIANDTVVVRAGPAIRITNLPEISLRGVLHSEVQDYLTTQLGRYLRQPVVEVTPLMRVAVLGAVGHPGFYSLRADMPLGDVIMAAGGPTQSADVNRTVVRREQEDVYAQNRVASAIAAGATLDQLGLRGGDAIVVGERKRTNWGTIAQIAGVGVGVIATIIAIKR